MTAANLGGHAFKYAGSHWEVLPLDGKVPRTAHGVDDATADLGTVERWWRRWPHANIGLKVPPGVVVIDIDPRNGGEATWAALHEHDAEVPTRTAVSGRGDGGRHLYYGHPGCKLGKLGDGLDLKRAGYVVAPPSLHPDTGEPYRWANPDAVIVPMPAHLVRVALPPRRQATATSTRRYDGDSVADWYTAHATWGEILESHAWHLVDGDGDEDGSVWRHPRASHATSATVKHGCLFVYSTGTAFEATEVGDPHGYTRFRAFATLEHDGDLSAAARAAAELRGES